tara:strand:- start:117 stop:1550 length:1434 start_codon:yes stop_codon:yes gene_type:complete
MFKQSLKSSIGIYFFLIGTFTSNIASPIDNTLSISSQKLLSEDNIKFEDIPRIIASNNLELKSLQELVTSASYNLTSEISKRYPSLNLNANGLPQYLYGKNYNETANTKTSQFKANPSLNLRWDLINPQRGLEINSARKNYEIARNNYEIKKYDLIQEAKSRYHNFHKSYEKRRNASVAVDLSLLSLKDAKSKLETGIGTKFDVLEANTQLLRDKQFLEEKKVIEEINKISLKEILNLDFKRELNINSKQKLMGFWNYKLNENINNGLAKSLSLKNINLQGLIKKNQAKIFNSANLPVIYISNNFSSSFSKGSTLTNKIEPEDTQSSYLNTISLNFSWNIFNGGRNINSTKAKNSEYESEKYAYSNLTNILKKNITEAYLTLLKNQTKVISTKQEIKTSKEALRLSRLRYEVGISTLKDVLLRQQELTHARTKNIDAIYNYNINIDKLERLTFLKKSSECLEINTDKKNKIYSLCNF